MRIIKENSFLKPGVSVRFINVAAILSMLVQAMKCAIFFFSYIEINHRITLHIKKLSLWSTPGTENTANTGIWYIEIHENSYFRLLLFFFNLMKHVKRNIHYEKYPILFTRYIISKHNYWCDFRLIFLNLTHLFRFSDSHPRSIYSS